VKAFLLAAGRGTRLRPYTETVPKCLLTIQGVPMLQIWLSLCRSLGISEVLVNTHAHADRVIEFVGRWKDGVRVSVVEEENLFGSAGTLRANRAWLASGDPFWVFYADVLTSVNLAGMLQFHTPESAATLGIYQVPDPGRCGIVTMDEHHVITEFEEKPASPKTNWAFAGIMIATQELLDAIPERFGADIAFDVLPRLTGRMRGYCLDGYVLDIGTIDNYLAAQNSWPGLMMEQTR
jgi:mannose-1-phosphate guanylyltransferase